MTKLMVGIKENCVAFMPIFINFRLPSKEDHKQDFIALGCSKEKAERLANSIVYHSSQHSSDEEIKADFQKIVESMEDIQKVSRKNVGKAKLILKRIEEKRGSNL